MWGYILTVIVGIYLLIMSILDWRKKEIPLLPGALLFIGVVLMQVIIDGWAWNCLFGILVGIGLYGISKLSQGAVGEGDALVYAIVGAKLGFTKNIEVLAYSLLFCSIAAIFLLITGRIKKKDKLAFIPFTAMAYGLVVIL